MKFFFVMFSVCFLAFIQHTAVADMWTDEFEVLDGGVVRSFTLVENQVAVKNSQKRYQIESAVSKANPLSFVLEAAGAKGKSAKDVFLMAQEKRADGSKGVTRIISPLVLVQIDSLTDIPRWEKELGLTYVRSPRYAPGYHVFEAPSSYYGFERAIAARSTAGVRSSNPMLARQQQKRFVPNDTLYTSQQWHLKNTGQNGATAGLDVNIQTVWDTYKGAGVLIGIVDDGLQLTHPDLSPNVNTLLDYDWNDDDNDPSPNLSFDYHGTSVGGVAAGRGDNGLGICGAAFQSTLVGMRLISDFTTDMQEADAMAHSNSVIDIKSNSWGPSDDGQTLEAPGPLTEAALADGCANGRSGHGVIYSWAGGNGLESNDNANYDGYANSIYTVAIGAMDDTGGHAYYSEPGACLIVTSPSSGDNQGITTTDLLGNSGYNQSSTPNELSDRDYTLDFGGTSSATPLASGIIALMLEANPNLGWRDVQEVLMRSAFKNNPGHIDWGVNGAGINFNHNYGAGLIDAGAAVALGQTWTNLGTQQSISFSQTGINAPIPDNNVLGVTRTFDLNATGLRVEHVTLEVSANHAYRGDLKVTLTSPSGTESVLTDEHGDGGSDYSGWKLMTVRNWGEDSWGIWTVKVADLAASDVGNLSALTLTVLGTDSASASNRPPVVSVPQSTISVAASSLVSFVVSASEPDGDTVTLSATGLPVGSTFPVTMGTGGATNTFNWTPTTNDAGSHVVSFIGADIHGTNTTTVTIDVVVPGSGTPLDIGNYALLQYDSSQSYTIPAGTMIEPNGYVVVGRDATQAAFEAFWGVTLGPNVVYLRSGGNTTPQINGAETYELRDDLSATVDGPSGQALSSGNSAQRIGANLDATLPGSWSMATASTTATPGSGGVGNGAGGLVISEYSDATGSGNYVYEFVELFYDISGGAPATGLPTMVPIADETVILGETLMIGVQASEPDNHEITLTASNLPVNASFPTIVATGIVSGTFTFTPTMSQTGQVFNATFYAEDQDGVTNQTIAITVLSEAPSNSLPIVFYDFEDESLQFDRTAEQVATHLTASLFGSYNGVPQNFSGNPGRAASDTGWNVADLSAYFEFTIEVDSGFSLDVSHISFDDRASGAGAANWEIRYSGDGYTAPLGAGATHGAFTSNGVPVNLLALEGTNTFRIYGQNGSGSSGTWRLDNVVLDGIVNTLSGGNDDDADGIPNDWEMFYTGSPTGVVAAADVDGDGFTGSDEYIADTHPTNGTSYIYIESIVENTGNEVSFTSSTNRIYALEISTNLLGSTWSGIVSNQVGTNIATSLIDTNVAGNYGAYRIRVSVP